MAWACVALWVFLIYATLYIVRPICEFLKDSTPFTILINTLLILIITGLAFYFYKNIGFQNKKAAGQFFFTVVVYMIALQKMEIPEEKVHLIEYGLLAFLLHRAVFLRFEGWHIYIISFIIAALTGWGDEGIQYLLPNRYYQFRDVLLNWFGAGMGFLVVGSLKKNHRHLIF